MCMLRHTRRVKFALNFKYRILPALQAACCLFHPFFRVKCLCCWFPLIICDSLPCSQSEQQFLVCGGPPISRRCQRPHFVLHPWQEIPIPTGWSLLVSVASLHGAQALRPAGLGTVRTNPALRSLKQEGCHEF